MSTITVVTTFHKPGLDLYGQRYINSFAKRVDKRIKLIVYAEDCIPENPDPDQITILDQQTSLPKLMQFKNTWKDVPKANGIPPDEIKHKRKDWNKDFKWHAVRFANKVYAVFGWMLIALFIQIGATTILNDCCPKTNTLPM